MTTIGTPPPRIVVLDMDSSESPTYGDQEGSAYNGHFGCTCYHPLFVFNQLGDLERCTLRPGNVHSADGWRAVLDPAVMPHLRRQHGPPSAPWARLQLGNFMRTLAMPKTAEPWSLTSLREKLIKAIGSDATDGDGRVRLDEGKATSLGPARRAIRWFGYEGERSQLIHIFLEMPISR